MQVLQGLRRIGPALAAALILSAAIAPATSAGAGPATARLTFGVDWDGLRIGSPCISGLASANSTVGLVWKSAAGAQKARTNVTAAAGRGFWSYCSDTSSLAAGDVLKVDDGLGDRTFTMPKITLIADRVNNVFRGKGLANRVTSLYYRPGLLATHYEVAEITAAADGRWSYDPGDDIIGGIGAEITWTTAKGDWMTAVGTAPYVAVTLGRSRFTGGTSPLQNVKVSLRDPATAVVKGRGSAVGGHYGEFAGEFVNANGTPVMVAAGDRFVSGIASDANWIVPNVEGSANVATDFVYGRCFDTGISFYSASVTVYRYGGGERGFSFASPDENGAFEIDFSEPDDGYPVPYDSANIKHGDRVHISCLQNTGDSVQLIFRVP